MNASVRVQVRGLSDVGLVREHNEDNLLIADLTGKRRNPEPSVSEHEIGPAGSLFAVCDGMGGAAAGEVASQIAVDTLFERLSGDESPRGRDDFALRLVRAVEEAGTRIFASAKLDRTRRGMGTTVTAAAVLGTDLFVAQVGDSRAYLLRAGRLVQVTKDQSLVNQLIETGQLSTEEAAAFEHTNIILQALGTTTDVAVDLTHVSLRRGDVLLLCSDGLSGLVPAGELENVLNEETDPARNGQILIDLAKASGGHDNVTVILASFDGDGLAPPAAAPDGDADAPRYEPYPLYRGGDGDAETSTHPGPTRTEPTPTTPPERAAEPPAPRAAGRASARAVRLYVTVAASVALLAGLGYIAAKSESTDRPRRRPGSPTHVVAVGGPGSATEDAPQPRAEVACTFRASTPGVLYVDGVALGPLGPEDRLLTLPAGGHRAELRVAGVAVADLHVDVQASSQNRFLLAPGTAPRPASQPSLALPAAERGRRPRAPEPSIPAERTTPALLPAKAPPTPNPPSPQAATPPAAVPVTPEKAGPPAKAPARPRLPENPYAIPENPY